MRHKNIVIMSGMEACPVKGSVPMACKSIKICDFTLV